jgi:hypothetical protein
VAVDVPNSYSASDNGKVVVNQELTEQTSRNVTVNGTYDTTTNNEVVVNVSGGGGGGEYSLSLAEYLQFYGTSPGQIIGLPYTVSSDYEIEVDFEVTETSSNNTVIGNSNGYNKPHLTIYNDKWYTSTGGNDLNFGNSSMLTGRHTVVINKNGNSVLFDEQAVLSNLSNNSYQGVYLWVGGRYSSSPGYTLAKAKIYEYKITSISTGNVICDLKPAEIKKNNNVVIIGLYDVINDVFYTSSGTTVSGTLIQKTITQNGTYNASDDNAYGYSSVTVNVSGGSDEIVIPDLPTGYTKIESVYFPGNNGYIKIPSVPANSKIKVKFQPKDNGEYPILASKNGDDQTSYDLELLYRTTSGIIPYLWCRDKNASMITYDDIDVSIIREQINPQPSVMNSQYLLIFYTKITIGIDYPSDSGQYIYIGYYQSSKDYKGNVYYCIVTNPTETENLYFFVPCYRNNDDAVGFYDVVNDVFYENEGKGTFQIGTYL